MNEQTKQLAREAEQHRQLSLRENTQVPALLPERPGLEFIVSGETLEADYLRALKANEPTGNQVQIVDGRNTRWKLFNSEIHPDLETATRTIKRWYNTDMLAGGGLMILGNCGSGKTHLARAIAELYGVGAVFTSEESFVKDVQGTYSNRAGKTEHQIMNRLCKAKLLVYDDLGAYQTDNTPWMQNLYFQLFDGRQDLGKATIITSNLSLAPQHDGREVWIQIEERLGARCFSRVMGQVGPANVVDLFNVPDYRMRGF